jgi:uncharacterized lipoprotein YajG
MSSRALGIDPLHGICHAKLLPIDQQSMDTMLSSVSHGVMHFNIDTGITRIQLITQAVRGVALSGLIALLAEPTGCCPALASHVQASCVM